MSKTEWGFDETDIGDSFDETAYNESLERYLEPITKHDCDVFGCEGRYTHVGYDTHAFHDVFDDFSLSQKQRENAIMEITRSRGRLNREMILIRRYVSTVDGSFVIRLQNSTELTREPYGDVRFDDEQECNDYYDYCIELFKFSSELKVGQPDSNDAGFFSDLDEIENSGFFSDLGDMDEEDGLGWDTEDDELTW